MMYKVIIVDDQYVARELFEYYIKSSDNYELENSLESIRLVITLSTFSLFPL